MSKKLTVGYDQRQFIMKRRLCMTINGLSRSRNRPRPGRGLSIYHSSNDDNLLHRTNVHLTAPRSETGESWLLVTRKRKLLPLHDTFLHTSKAEYFMHSPLDRYVSISTSARLWEGDKLLSRCVLFTAEMREDFSRRQSRQNKPSCIIVMTLRHFQGVS